MKRTALFVLLILAVAGLWTLLQKTGLDMPLTAPAVSISPGAAETAKPDTANFPEAIPTSTTEENPSVEFQKWLRDEGESIETSTANPREKELELLALARKLSPVEVGYLAKQSLLSTNSARQRIFATYFLTLAPEVTQSGLFEVLQAPSEYPGQHPVHSPEEALATQERSLRRMALDALLERAKSNPEARADLRKFISQITDETLRNYAERSLEAIK